MGRADRLLKELLELPEEERTQLVLALLDRLESHDPHSHLSDEELVGEIDRRADEATLGEGGGADWASLATRIRGALEV